MVVSRRGDAPLMKISMSSPDLTAAETDAVVKVLQSGSLSIGPAIRNFEKRFADRVGRKFAVAVSSGTAALHLAVIAAGITEGDLVITSPFSFVASANCLLYERAEPLFVDVEPITGNIDPDAVERALTDTTPERRRRIKGILPVHASGQPADMSRLMEIAERH